MRGSGPTMLHYKYLQMENTFFGVCSSPKQLESGPLLIWLNPNMLGLLFFKLNMLKKTSTLILDKKWLLLHRAVAGSLIGLMAPLKLADHGRKSVAHSLPAFQISSLFFFAGCTLVTRISAASTSCRTRVWQSLHSSPPPAVILLSCC